MSLLWISSTRPDGIPAIEQTTGLKVTVSDAEPMTWNAGNLAQFKAILIELPVPDRILKQLLADALNTPTPLGVVFYDRDGALDESLLRPPLPIFRHATGHLHAEALGSIVRSTIEKCRLQLPLRDSSSEPWQKLLVGASRPMRELHAMIRLVSRRQATVLISGETGTGKEIVARAIHMASRRAASPMVAVNCAALPENLFEAELFGHARGAFTGAINDRIGRFEQASGGTIFLDEIGEMPLEVQPKLLRVLQEQELQRVGSSKNIHVDTRVIAASNTDLTLAVSQKRFREDLFYRLNIVPIKVPPLRDRLSDVPLLAEHFIEKICRAEGLPLKELSADALQRLSDYEWPGNVRQLEHIIEMAVALSGERENLYSGDIQLPAVFRGLAEEGPEIDIPSSGVDFEEVIGRVERLLLQEALRKCGGNKAKAASSLGLKRTTLLYKVKALEQCA
jgi:two-component system response regulator AtoC